MSDTYRKWGRVARFENGTVVRVDEAGEAVDGEEFVAAPLRGERRVLPDIDATPLRDAARTIAPLNVERLVLSEGVTVHQCGGVVWSERARRMHLSIAASGARVLIDEAHFALDVGVIEAVRRFGGRAEAGPVLITAPRVSAALLLLLIGEVAMEQRGDGDGRDGMGEVIATRRVTRDAPPNWYRPSYRIRPVRSWFNLAAFPFGAVAPSAPRAVALLAPPSGRTIEVLCDDGTARAFTFGRILAAGEAERWYPYAAGAWGATMLLESQP